MIHIEMTLGSLSMGGGPGSAGMMNALLYEGPCILSANGTTPNQDRWTEKFNLLALDHVRVLHLIIPLRIIDIALFKPIGVGYSYGTRVNNSQDAAEDVYDFLQKFFKLYPNLAKYGISNVLNLTADDHRPL